LDAIGLIPSFGGVAFTIVVFVLALSIIVTVHEYGHYIVGRWSGIHAEVFSLGFGPVLWSRHDRRGTKWQIAVLPLGGYVKFLGDADAASAGKDEGFLEHVVHAEREKELRRSMLGAPLWARAATVAAGPLFNFIMSILIFAAFFMIQGVRIEPVTVGALANLPVAEANLRPGDVIVAIDGRPTPDEEAFYKVLDEIEVAPMVDFTVLRDGTETRQSAPWPVPNLIASLQPGSAAIDAGLEVGDVIVALDDKPLVSFRELLEVVKASDGRPLKLGVWRDGDTFDVTLQPRRMDVPSADGGFETRWLIGITRGLAFEPATEALGPVAAVTDGARQVVFLMRTSLSGLWHMITGAISSCNLRGPLGIAETSGDMASQGVGSFIWFVAVLSTAVGLLNLFPIPVLDGGHLVFHAYEAIVRRPPSERALKAMMGTGLVLILALMVFALSNDLFCP
jgi:regulator of sigma E protease